MQNYGTRKRDTCIKKNFELNEDHSNSVILAAHELQHRLSYSPDPIECILDVCEEFNVDPNTLLMYDGMLESIESTIKLIKILGF